MNSKDKHKIPKANYKVIEGGLKAKDGIAIIEDLIYNNDLPDAFFCFNDLVAFGVIKRLKRQGFRVPEDIAVMGFTETQMAELNTPQLSSVKQPTFEIGKKTAELLLQLIDKGPDQPETIILNGELNIRESTLNEKVTVPS